MTEGKACDGWTEALELEGTSEEGHVMHGNHRSTVQLFHTATEHNGRTRKDAEHRRTCRKPIEGSRTVQKELDNHMGKDLVDYAALLSALVA